MQAKIIREESINSASEHRITCFLVHPQNQRTLEEDITTTIININQAFFDFDGKLSWRVVPKLSSMLNSSPFLCSCGFDSPCTDVLIHFFLKKNSNNRQPLSINCRLKGKLNTFQIDQINRIINHQPINYTCQNTTPERQGCGDRVFRMLNKPLRVVYWMYWIPRTHLNVDIRLG